jgi:hypothetical protein
MAVRTAYAGTIAALDAITAANNNKLPGGCIGYKEKSTVTSGITGTSTTILTETVTVNTNRLIKVEFAIPFVLKTGADYVKVRIVAAGSPLASFSTYIPDGQRAQFAGHALHRPGASASITYLIDVLAATGSVAVECSADGDPGLATMTITDLSPTFT